MILYIDDTVLEHLQSSSNLTEMSPEVIKIDEIANSVLKGHHLLFTSYETIEFVSKMRYFSERTRKVFLKILNYQTSFKVYLDTVKKYIRIIHGNTKNDNEISLNEFNPQKSILICEDRSDAEFYIEYCEYIRKYKYDHSVSISLEIRHGGGNNIKKEVIALKGEQSIFLSIVDSDKVHSNDELGYVAKSLKPIMVNEPNCDLIILNVGQKENLLSPNQLMDCTEPQQKFIEYLRNLDINDNLEFLKFCPVKSGLSVIKFKNMRQLGIELYDFHIQCLERLEMTFCCFNQIDTMEDKQKVFKISLEKSFKKSYKNLLSTKNFGDIVPDYLKEQWEILYNYIITYGLSLPEQMRVFN